MNSAPSPKASVSTLSVVWRPRDRPLAPVAVVAQGETARNLARRVLARDDTELAQLAGVASPNLLLLLGDESILPWADGAIYLGRDSSAPSLLVPTNRIASVPLPLLERALTKRFPSPALPLAILPDSQTVISSGAARTLERARLQTWVEQLRGVETPR